MQDLVNAIAEMMEDDAMRLTKKYLDEGVPPIQDSRRLQGGSGHHWQAFRGVHLFRARADPGR